ncbi:MAG: hypothetical protein NTV34_06930, partial [Proteobacteria bacterium]|nr:hypothetical protein [Pseudomonadota bacterium]
METTTIANQSRIQTKSAPDSKSSKSSLNQLKDLSGSSAGGFKTLRYSVTTCTYRDISDDLFALRKLVYHDETGLLAIGNLIDENDQKGEHVVIRDNVSGKIIATSMTIPAEESDFAIYSGLKPSQLTSWFLGSRAMVHPEWRSKGLYKLIVYLVARHARINGRKGYIAFIEEGEGKHARKVM